MTKTVNPTISAASRKRLFRRYVNVALNLYGVMKIDDFVEVFNHYEAKKTDRKEVRETLNDLSKDERCDLSFLHNIMANGYFLLDDERDLEEARIVLSMQKGKPRYLPSKTEFFRYVDENYIEPLKSLLELERFIKENQLVIIKEPKDISYDVLELHDLIVFGNPASAFFEYIEKRGYKFIDMDQMQLFTDLVMAVNNNTRIYENNGFTPYELRKLFTNKENNATGTNRA